MTWTIQDLGALGELMSAIAVLVTLVYLARQVTANTASIREANLRAHTDRAIEHSRFVAGTPGMMSIFRRGCEDLSQLTDDERWQFGTYLFSLYQGFQEAYHEHLSARTDDWHWEQFRKSTLPYLRRPGGASWWNSAQLLFDDAFAKYINDQLETNN